MDGITIAHIVCPCTRYMQDDFKVELDWTSEILVDMGDIHDVVFESLIDHRWVYPVSMLYFRKLHAFDLIVSDDF